VADVARALGVSSHSLYTWLRQYGKPADQQLEESALQAEIRRLKAELRQVTEERNILKEAAAYFASESRKGTRS
jgi:transposase